MKRNLTPQDWLVILFFDTLVCRHRYERAKMQGLPLFEAGARLALAKSYLMDHIEEMEDVQE